MKSLVGILVFALTLTITLLFSSCDKPVYKYNPEFEGKWRTLVVYDTFLNSNVQSEIVIDGKDGSFMNTCNPCGVELCDCISSQLGKAVVNSDGTQMQIGSNSYPLTINEQPNLDANGEWTMEIQGLRYYRQ